MGKFIAIKTIKDIQVHGRADFGAMDTICGIDADDSHPSVQQSIVGLPKNPKITCAQCKDIILSILRFNKSDLAKTET